MLDNLETLKQHPACLRLYTQRVQLRADGKEWIGCCPFHSEKTASFKVSQKNSAWLWFCFGCNSGGDVIKFVERFDHLAPKQAIEKVRSAVEGSWESKRQQVEQTFREIAPSPKQHRTYPLSEYRKYEQALAANPKALTWLKSVRGISAETSKRLHLGFRQDVGMLAGASNQDIAASGWLAFPCIEGDTVVSIKYRSLVRKAFTRQAGMATALWNTPTVDPLSPLYVVEGELDACALEQAGFRAVSLPSASVNLSPAMRDQIMQADIVILAGDCDGAAGSRTMEKLWAELGDRSYLLKWTGVKDANDCLLKTCGGDTAKFKAEVEQLTVQARSVPMPGVYSLQEAMACGNRTNLADHPLRLRFPWKVVDEMAILLPGAVMAISATNTGMGKTAWITQATLHGARKHNEVVLSYQCELTSEELSNLVASHLLRKDRNHLAPEDYQKAAQLLTGVRYYVGRDPNLTTVEPVLDLIEAAVRRLGVTVVVLDHLNFICRNSDNEIQSQANAMQRIKRMAAKYGLKFIVVAQPRKASEQSKGKALHLTQFKGSESVTSDSDTVFALHRDYVKVKDPANPPNDPYEPRTEVHLLKARAKGDGPAFCELMFVGALATFAEMAREFPPTGVAS